MAEQTREAWLTKAVEMLVRDVFDGEELPTQTRVSCGWPAVGALSEAKPRIGECWHYDASDGKVSEVFVSPKVDDPVAVLDILTHELIHVYEPDAGHRGAFTRRAKAAGLEGKMTATVAGEELRQKLTKIAKRLGDYPHSRITSSRKRKVQTTRMLKVMCPEEGYTVRMTRKWLDEMGPPTCPCGATMVEQDAGEES